MRGLGGLDVPTFSKLPTESGNRSRDARGGGETQLFCDFGIGVPSRREQESATVLVGETVEDISDACTRDDATGNGPGRGTTRQVVVG